MNACRPGALLLAWDKATAAFEAVVGSGIVFFAVGVDIVPPAAAAADAASYNEGKGLICTRSEV